MPFKIDDEEDIENPYGNPDEWDAESDGLTLEEAYALVKKIFSVTRGRTLNRVSKLKFLIKELFDVFPKNTFKDELKFYNEMNLLADKFVEQNTLKKVHDKVVVGVGGRFSAGKSKFLNSITGCENVLPEDQDPSTSIPTYVIKASNDSYRAYASGSSYNLTLDEMQALSHVFKKKYDIGFSSFIDSVFIEKKDFCQSEKLVFLDTPGYSKPDSKTKSSKASVSDKEMAIALLNKVDFLIWLVDVDSLMTNDDINFINQQLNVSRPVLIVLNKIDRHNKNASKIQQFIQQTKESLSKFATFKVYDVVAYSSLNGEEFKQTHIIQDYLDQATRIRQKNNDILDQIASIEMKLRKSIEMLDVQQKELENSLLQILQRSNSVTNLKALATLLKQEKQNGHRLYYGKQRFEECMERLKEEIHKMMK